MSEQASSQEQRQMAREATDCPALLALESFCADVRSIRDAGSAWEIVTAPYCDPQGIWRAEIRRGRTARWLHWEPNFIIIQRGRDDRRGIWTWSDR